MQPDRNLTQDEQLPAQHDPGDEPLLSATQTLLDLLVASGNINSGQRDVSREQLQTFFSGNTLSEKLQAWFGRIPRTAAELTDCRRRLSRDIASIDVLLSDQVNAILHQPAFQRLEASWRGLQYLWNTARDLTVEHGMEDQGARFEIRVLDVSRKELKRDFEDAVDFDQNALFRKVYEEEFGTAGGHPYGMLVADYEFTNHPDDVDLMGQLAGVGAAAFAPVIASAGPEMFGIENFNSLEQPLDLDAVFGQPKYRKWRSLRSRPDAQFLGLTVPRILMREPYRDDGQQHHGFRFREDVESNRAASYLWGSAGWGFAAVLMRAFAAASWFADIRGVERGEIGGGLVTGLPAYSWQTDADGVADRSSVDVMISDDREAELCKHGFIPLSHCQGTPYSVFYSNQSVHEPVVYDDEVATANARVSAMLQYVLCCSRIAHYLKIRIRDKIGGMSTPRQVEDDLLQWLMNYVTPDDKAPAAMKARYPLRSAEVQVTEIPGEPGKYMMTLRLLPHYQLDQLSSSLSLIARRIELAE